VGELAPNTPTSHPSSHRFYLNRYRTVVWQYLAEELRQFAVELGGRFAQLRRPFARFQVR
jgi:hypothetical protein